MIDVQFVLVRPQHSGNVGAVARAMYVCGLEKLVIVDSKSIVDQEALSRSVKASYILNDAIHCDDLSSALSDSSWTIVCSARPRHLNFNCITPDELVYTYQKMPNNSKISIVFGPERTGLTTDEIIMGNQLLSIPMQHTNTSYTGNTAKDSWFWLYTFVWSLLFNMPVMLINYLDLHDYPDVSATYEDTNIENIKKYNLIENA